MNLAMQHRSVPWPASQTRRPAVVGSALCLALTALLAIALPAHARDTALPMPRHAVIGVEDQHLDPAYWIAKLARPQHALLDTAGVAAQNRQMVQADRHVHDLDAVPASLTRDQVREWLVPLSAAPTRTLYDVQGREVSKAQLASFAANAAVDTVAAQAPARYGLVVHRADLRTFPTRERVFSSRGDTDIDRFQESALFPGTPVVIAHASADGDWYFVVSPLYAAWIEKRFVAEGARDVVLGYGRGTPSLVVTGATARTVYNPEEPGLSELQLDMGVRVPVLNDWPADAPVNGQHPYTSYVVQLPVRRADGALALLPALLPRTADVSTDYLPLTHANLLRQGFKFLGERYGWGHSYNTRDCSGFVSEVYRSMGVTLPRNTSAQAVSPALERVGFDASDSHEKRLAVLRTLRVGDLVYIPGHVMMVIGHDKGTTYTIHDTTGITYRGADGTPVRARLNSVAVTPLEPLMFNSEQSTVDRITAIQRIRPQGAP
ncbi:MULTISPECIES: SH3 domain-containing protein [unclassified Pseudoxanthomonas]|uniref:C40 family peptidase n=1 Tax=unclassified Pseudoxanthomonas TaxID=2645906 RepID=UPI0008E03D67|nr:MULTISPECIES: SH3 domain-containing protein [unclassified Pseudoxanthomonas]SFV31351.1 NlpC/P60 family protein [Pseudoxanthomonas sp. YR558]